MSKARIVSVNGSAARAAVADAGRRAGRIAAGRAAAGTRVAKRKAAGARRGAAKRIAAQAARARRLVGRRIGERRRAALRTALRICVDLSDKQLALLRKLERNLTST